MRLNVRLISLQKKTFEQIAQPRGSRSKKHQTSKCFVSQFLSELREMTSPPNRTPYQKHDPTKNTLNRVPPPVPKPWLESTNQLGLRRQLVQFKEGSSLITARQLSTMNARVLLFLDVFGALRRLDSKPTHFGTNALPSSKKRF